MTWTGSPHWSPPAGNLKSSSLSDHFVTTPRGPILVLSPRPVTSRRANRDFRTDNGTARVGLSPLIKDSDSNTWSIFLLTLSNRTFTARTSSAHHKIWVRSAAVHTISCAAHLTHLIAFLKTPYSGTPPSVLGRATHRSFGPRCGNS